MEDELTTSESKEATTKPSVEFKDESDEIRWEEEMDLQQAWMVEKFHYTLIPFLNNATQLWN